ncbi:MAG TPA: hypothetical protein VGL56_11060 [Fimbriimonadaceae bacterium]
MKVLILAALVFCLALVGCGGTIGNGSSVSVYSGTYAGTYSRPSVPENGSVALSVDQFGNLSGTTTNAATQAVYNITGTVDNSNNISGSLTNTANSVTTTITFSGTFIPGTPVNGVVPYTASLNDTNTTTTATFADTWSLTQTSTGTFKKKAVSR